MMFLLILMGFCSVIGTIVCSEPSCSNFENEEKLLDKMIHMEVKMEALERQILETNQPCLDSLRDLNKAKLDWVDKYRELELKNSKLENHLSELYTILHQQPSAVRFQEPVAFLAELTKSFTGSNLRIHFDDVKLNLGNAYNPDSGSFVVPFNGTYLFDVTACSKPGYAIVLEINVNKSVLGKLIAGDDEFSDCNSKLFIAQLKVGNDVFVTTGSYGNFVEAFPTYGLPSITGVLLQRL